jgi:putative transposase
MPVKPDTVIAWHRHGFRLFWKWKSRRRGRPSVPLDVRALNRTMSDVNPLWGAPRIHGELLKLGIGISQASVAKYMDGRRSRSPTWRTFVANHVTQLTAANFFVVPTATYRLLVFLFSWRHDRRRIVHIVVTANPTAAWTAQQLWEAFP